MSEASVTAPVAKRVEAIEQAMKDRNMVPSGFIEDFARTAEEDWIHTNGSKIVARAWSDPSFRSRLLSNGRAAAVELGFSMPEHHRHLVVLENTAEVHNVICCTLCSCTAFTIVGLPPGWYKELEYRSRVVRESRTVLAEMGLALPDGMEVRVWDTTADTRYMVLPVQPLETVGWAEDRLVALISKESMIGVSRLEKPYAA